jgi:hypothetical protein
MTPIMHISNNLFKRILVIFWGFWWLIAFLTDFLGGLQHLKLIDLSLNIDTNYPFLVKSLMPFNPPHWLPAYLFIMLMIWALISSLLFFWASLASKARWLRLANIAFIVSLGLWLAFFLADQIIMNFDLEANHMVQGGFQLLCFFALYLLPEQET